MVVASNPALRMLWLELTRSCNEHCDHCYNDSGPHRAGEKTLAQGDWFRILSEARDCGASEVQFIGGEPTLIPWLPEALAHAKLLGYEMIEVFTNGTKLSDALIETFRNHGIRVAVSLYSHDPAVHDQMTALPGSHARTVDGLRRLQIAAVPTRVAVIRVPLNKEGCEATVQFARELGIENAGIDDARAFGRAQALTGRAPQLKELCGHCWNGTLCIDPQGQVSPCIMSRHFVVGNAGTTPMGEILAAPALAGKREEIYREVWLPRQHEPTACNPNSPYPPGCFPASTPSNPCGPHTCGPSTGPCYPLGKGLVQEDVCAPGAEPGGILNLSGGVEEARQAVGALSASTGCQPNNPNPAGCFPASTADNPCAPHTCGPGSACYPLGK